MRKRNGELIVDNGPETGSLSEEQLGGGRSRGDRSVLRNLKMLGWRVNLSMRQASGASEAEDVWLELTGLGNRQIGLYID